MTPRGKIVWIDINDPLEATIRATIEHPHTRYVVCDGELDRVLGIVDLRDLWADQPDYWTPQVSQQRVAANAPAPAAVGR